MRANEVSIVVCANCGHSHDDGFCMFQEPGEQLICGCDAWHPILKPFAEAGKPKPIPNGDEHWAWKVLAWALLIGLFMYALTMKGGA